MKLKPADLNKPMKTRNLIQLRAFLALLASLGAASAAVPLGTAFTYQGKLTDGGGPAQGIYDLRFTIYDSVGGANALAGPQTYSAVGVTNGLFTITLDFGQVVFSGQAVWLEIAARTNGTGTFATFPVRQSLTAAPYALYAANAGTAVPGAVSVSSLNTSATPTPGQVLTFNGSQLAWMSLSSTGAAWNVTGNSGTAPGASFLGTTDNQPLEFKVNAQRALRLEPQVSSPNIIGGSLINSAAPGTVGATIAGGGSPDYGPLHWAATNSVLDDFGVVGGGLGNAAGGLASVVAGGDGNRTERAANQSTISGGEFNTIMAGSTYATIGGGYLHTIETNSSGGTIAGGYGNRIKAGSRGATVGGGWAVGIGTNAPGSTIAGGDYNQIVDDSVSSFVGGGSNNVIETKANFSTIVGGRLNSIQARARDSTLGGGMQNTIGVDDWASTIAGGALNSVGTNAYGSVIGGGYFNSIQANAAYSVIGGGTVNKISTNASSSSIGGGTGNAILMEADNSFLGAGRNNIIAPEADAAFLGGGYGNTIGTNAFYGVLCGGGCNVIETNADSSFLGGGFNNTNGAAYSVVPGGLGNFAAGQYSFAAGRRAKAYQDGAFVWADSTDTDFASTRNDQFCIRAGGGVYIQSDRGIALNAADQPMITRGWDPFDATAPPEKQGLGRWGMFMEPLKLVMGIPADDVAGRYFTVAKYNRDGTRVELLAVKQSGELDTMGPINPPSDRALKQGFSPVDARAVLERVASLPINSWAYTNSPAVRHLGPVAQDFYAAFGLGTDDKHIATVDADGVALAAIQGLNQKVEETAKQKDARIEALEERLQRLRQEKDRKIAELEKRLATLEQLVLAQPREANGGGL